MPTATARLGRWGGAGVGADKKGAPAAPLGLRACRFPGRERAWPTLPRVDVTSFLPSLSLPPSLSACFSLLSLSLCPTPCAYLPSPAYFCRLRLLGAPHSSAFPSRLVLPAFSLSAPGGRYTAVLGPRHYKGRGLGARTPGPWADRLRKCKAPREGGEPLGVDLFLGPKHACPCLSVSSHALLCPRPQQPRLPALALPLTPLRAPPEALPPVLSPGPLPPLPFQGAG